MISMMMMRMMMMMLMIALMVPMMMASMVMVLDGADEYGIDSDIVVIIWPTILRSLKR